MERLEIAAPRPHFGPFSAVWSSDRLGIVYGLTLFTKLAVASSDNETAGVLWGAIESEAEASLPLDDADFERGRGRGRRLSLDEAVEVARGQG